MNKNPFLVISKLIVDSHEFDDAMDIINYLMLKEDDELLAKEKQFRHYGEYVENYTKRVNLKEETDFIKIITGEITKYHKVLNDEQKITLNQFIKKYKIDLFQDYKTFKENEEIYQTDKSLLINIVNNESLFCLLADTLFSNEHTKKQFIDYIYQNNVVNILVDNNFYDSLMLVKKYGIDINVSENKQYPIFNINNHKMYEFLNNNFKIDWTVKDEHDQSVLQYISNNKENDLLIKSIIQNLKKDDSFNEQIGQKIFESIRTHTNKKDILKLINTYEGDIRNITNENGDNLIMTCVAVGKYSLAYELYNEYQFNPEFINKSGKNLLTYIIKDYKKFNLATTIESKKKSLIQELIKNEITLNYFIKDMLTSSIDINYKDNYHLSHYISESLIIDQIQNKHGKLFDNEIKAIRQDEKNRNSNSYHTPPWSDNSMVKLFSYYEPLKPIQFKQVYTQISDLLTSSTKESKEEQIDDFISETQQFLVNDNILALYKYAINDNGNEEVIQNITHELIKNYNLDNHVSNNMMESIKLIKWCNNLGIQHLKDESIYQLTEIITKVESFENYKNTQIIEIKIKLEQEVLNRNLNNKNINPSRKIKI